jgi:uncharacterized protein (TIGR04255 family)
MRQERTFELDPAETFPHLAEPPIVEAVIHWVARATRAFSKEELQRAIADRLPDYPEIQPQHQLQIETPFATDGSSTQVRHESWHGFRLSSADKRHVVQFTRDGLVFSRLLPYEGWVAFSAEGQRVWSIFLDLAFPSDVQRLGVRFINRMAPVELRTLGRYLAKAPKCLEPFGLPLRGFFYQSAHDVPGHPFQVNVVQTVQPPAPPWTQGFGLILDIDVFTTQSFPATAEDVQDHLPKMRWLKNKAFFSLVSKKSIKSFERERT